MKKAVLEGLLFVVGEEGLTLDQIEDVLNEDIDIEDKVIKLKNYCLNLNMIMKTSLEVLE